MSQHAPQPAIATPTGQPDAHAGRPPNLAHHFEDLSQQKESATLGMWLFLITEVMLFGGLFCAYIIYRRSFYDAFTIGSNRLYITFGTINTVVLLGSSFAMALAVHAAHAGDGKKIAQFIYITIALGSVFLCIKAVEYFLDYKEGLIPWGSWWHFDEYGPYTARYVKLFFVFYLIMTLLHAIHMTAGMLLLAWVAHEAKKGKYTAQYSTPVEMYGLYWHFVDIVWVFLFPALYLVNPALKAHGHG